ncbi:MAG: hypothetical protein NTX76_05795 [Alphaproteobacteria bacterium]|nr:hypothetical protein [Alphaproteobacteria bacterium]
MMKFFKYLSLLLLLSATFLPDGNAAALASWQDKITNRAPLTSGAMRDLTAVLIQTGNPKGEVIVGDNVRWEYTVHKSVDKSLPESRPNSSVLPGEAGGYKFEEDGCNPYIGDGYDADLRSHSKVLYAFTADSDADKYSIVIWRHLPEANEVNTKEESGK